MLMKKSFWIVLAVCLFSVAILAAPTNLALKKEYIFNIDAHTNYPDEGTKLTDGIYANVAYNDPNMLAHLREDFRIVIIDLKDVYKIDKVYANFLNSGGVGCYMPLLFSLAVSQDGKRWKILDYQEYTEDDFPKVGDYVNKFEFKTKGEKARYVALKFSTEIWVFMDEMEVIGDPDTKEPAPKGYSLGDIDFEEIDFDF